MVARVKEERPSPVVADPEDVRAALDRVLGSKHFAHAPKKQKFLRLICDFYLAGRAGELNEYLIGREVFNRDEAYNPAADPIVRVGAHDVRKKLEAYYQQEGAGDELRLDIPVGGYEPIFSRRPEVFAEQIPEAPEAPEAIDEPPLGPAAEIAAAPAAPRRWLTAAVVGPLALAVVALAYINYNLRGELKAAASRDPRIYGGVWEPFLAAGEPPLVVLGNPPVYRFSNLIDPMSVTEQSVELTPQQAAALKDKFVMKQNRIPRLVLSMDSYTGVGEAVGLGRLTDLFRAAGPGVLLKQSRTVSAEDLKNHNVIMLGAVWSNEWSGKLLVKEDFTHTGSATIANSNPRPGEEPEYRPRFDPTTGQLLTDYALITVKPNISDDETVMVLAGIHSQGTEAAAEYVTGKGYLQDLGHRLGALGAAPKYYQVLLQVDVENGIPTKITPVTIHDLRAQ